MPLNMDDMAQLHPDSSTLESLHDGSTSHVNVYSYQRYKFRLYQLSSPIITDLHAQDKTDIGAVATKTEEINSSCWTGSHHYLANYTWLYLLNHGSKLPMIRPRHSSCNHLFFSWLMKMWLYFLTARCCLGIWRLQMTEAARLLSWATSILKRPFHLPPSKQSPLARLVVGIRHYGSQN